VSAEAPRPRPRGRAGLYALAFFLMIGAGAVLLVEVHAFLASTRLLWASTALSAVAILFTIASVSLRSRK
jgi:hypothetical protein